MKKLYLDNDYQKAKGTEKFTLECYYCKNPYLTTKYKIQRSINGTQNGKYTSQFCSPKCRAKHHNKDFTKEVCCKHCDKKFIKSLSQINKHPNHFCSKSCAATYNNAHKTKGTRVSKLEKWLQEQLKALYPQFDIKYNEKQAINSELDIYIPELKIAFELNGIFHYEPIYGPDKLKQIKNNDDRKFQACIENEIELVIMDVSGMSYFKIDNAQKFLIIIKTIIESKIKIDR